MSVWDMKKCILLCVHYNVDITSLLILVCCVVTFGTLIFIVFNVYYQIYINPPGSTKYVGYYIESQTVSFGHLKVSGLIIWQNL